MQVIELKTEIEEVLGEPLYEDQLFPVFNECLRQDLPEVLRLETPATTSLDDVVSTATLPEDMYKLLAVKVNEGFLSRLSLGDIGQGYTLFGSVIEPQQVEIPNTLTVLYHRLPKKITSLNDVPDIPEQYHHILKYYFLAKYKKDDQDTNAGNDYMAEYINMRQIIDQSTKGNQGSRRRAQVTIYRR